MQAQKVLSVFATVSILVLSAGCNDRYTEGLADGKAQGYSEGYGVGYSSGDKDGFARAQTYFASADYQQGFNAGKAEGISIGYNQGYTVGKNDGINVGYNTGYNHGYSDGYYDGDANGYSDGIQDGYDMGYYDGYDDGYYDGYYGLSVGKTKKLQGYADVLSTFHNELIDYSKIATPVQTKHGLVANGQLLLSETANSSKDVLKRSAVAEQYLVIEMAKQVKAKFGLSDERSIKIAKASNHFRKYASKRALKNEDSNAYAEEILGANFDEISDAVTDMKKGNLSSFKNVMDKAAQKNETSPEQMATIVSKLFL